jgi:hypothetical protein
MITGRGILKYSDKIVSIQAAVGLPVLSADSGHRSLH